MGTHAQKKKKGFIKQMAETLSPKTSAVFNM